MMSYARHTFATEDMERIETAQTDREISLRLH